MTQRSALAVLLAAAALVAACVVATRPTGGPDRAQPVIVGGRGLQGDAIRAAGGSRPGGIAAAGDQATESAWLEGEARALGVSPADGTLSGLRRAVADALVDRAHARTAAAFVAAFDAFHATWRSRTRCLEGYTDPYADRCAGTEPRKAGYCRWMGEAWLCSTGRVWTVVGDGPRAAARLRSDMPAIATRVRFDRRRGSFAVRLRSHETAARAVLAVYLPGRQARDAAADRAKAAEARADRRREAAAERARATRAQAERDRVRDARLADPRLTPATIGALQPTCRQYAAEVEPYAFALGLQDPAGSSQGIMAARMTAERELTAAAADTVDRGKLRPLLERMRATDRALGRLEVAAVYGDDESLKASLARHRAFARSEASVASRLGVGDCLASPTG
jgi:hypothetical protein